MSDYGTPVIRGPRTEQPYAIVHHDDIRNSRLSFRARGVLAFLLSFPEGEDANWSAEQLAKHSPETVREIRAAMRELQDAGYGTEDAEA